MSMKYKKETLLVELEDIHKEAKEQSVSVYKIRNRLLALYDYLYCEEWDE